MKQFFYSTKEILGNPTLKNYFFSTTAHFDVVMSMDGFSEYSTHDVDAKWEDMKLTSGFEYHTSPKSVDSEYLIDKTTGDIYRKSQHWGRISTCEWTTENHDANICYRHYCIAKCNIKDFSFRGNILFSNVKKITDLYL